MAQTVAITEGSGHVILTFSGGKKKYVPKTGFALLYDPNSNEEDKVILSWASGDNLVAYDFERLNYLNVSSPSLANDQALVDLLVSYAVVATSGGGAGGGSIVYTNAAGDFTATPTTSAKTITITGLPFTLEEINVMGGSIKKRTSAGVVSTLDLSDVVVSAGVITLADIDDFAAGDEVYVTLIGPDKSYDKSLDSEKSNVQNPEWAHYTDVDHIVDQTDDAIANDYYSPEIFMDGFRNLAIQLTGNTGGTGVVFSIFATLNPDAATPTPASAPSSDWVNVSTAILGAATVTLNGGASGLYYTENGDKMPVKYVIQYDIDHATNTTDIFIRKY
jgi:hypothetical protein